MTKNPKSKTIIVTTTELGKILGISARTVRSLAEADHVERTAPGRFDYKRSVQKYCAYLREVAAKRQQPSAATEGQIRLLRLKADALERKNAEEAALYVRADEAAERWAEIRERLRTGVLDVVARVRKALPNLDEAALAMLRAELDAATSVLDQPVPLGKPGPKRRAVRG